MAARSGACRPHRRGVGIVAANLAISRVTVDHRVHVAGRHAPEQIGLAQGLEGLGAGPVGLGDDAHAKALRLQHATDDGHAEARVIHIGIARDQNDVAAVPAELIHLRATHGQERRRAEALGPVRLVAGQRLGIAMEKETSTGAFMWMGFIWPHGLCGERTRQCTFPPSALHEQGLAKKRAETLNFIAASACYH